MSFSENPFHGMSISSSPNEESYRWHCDNCGADSKEVFDSLTPLGKIRSDYSAHVRKSHELKETDVESWYSPWFGR